MEASPTLLDLLPGLLPALLSKVLVWSLVIQTHLHLLLESKIHRAEVAQRSLARLVCLVRVGEAFCSEHLVGHGPLLELWVALDLLLQLALLAGDRWWRAVAIFVLVGCRWRVVGEHAIVRTPIVTKRVHLAQVFVEAWFLVKVLEAQVEIVKWSSSKERLLDDDIQSPHFL